MSENIYLNEIKTRLNIIKDNIDKYAINKPVEIVAVSKFQNTDNIEMVHRAGVEHFAENRAQELRDKLNVFKRMNVKVSFIGRIQKNKVKYLLNNVNLIQSVSSYEIAEYINDKYEKENLNIDILLQINISNEESKSGFHIKEFMYNYKRIKMLKALNIKGIMTIATLTDNISVLERDFSIMKQLFYGLKANDENIKILSMGMSDDYTIALKYGANMIRIGRYIFGERLQ